MAGASQTSTSRRQHPTLRTQSRSLTDSSPRPCVFKTWLSVAVHVLAVLLADVLLDSLLAQLVGARVAVLLHVGLLAVVTPPSL